MEIKHTPEQSKSKRRDQNGNLKIFWKKWKWKHSILKLFNTAIAVIRGKLITANAYIKKWRKISNKQSSFISQGTSKKNKLSSKVAEGRKK